jgi:hypothetical protein
LKHSLVLKQHSPYAALICKALDFCELILNHTDQLYPFAAFTANSDVECIFVPSHTQAAEPGLIEALEIQLNQHQLYTESSVSLLVYNAVISAGQCPSNDCATPKEGKAQTDALVFNITDTSGQNNVTIYPYCITKNGIKIEKPYTCDFSD